MLRRFVVKNWQTPRVSAIDLEFEQAIHLELALKSTAGIATVATHYQGLSSVAAWTDESIHQNSAIPVAPTPTTYFWWGLLTNFTVFSWNVLLCAHGRASERTSEITRSKWQHIFQCFRVPSWMFMTRCFEGHPLNSTSHTSWRSVTVWSISRHLRPPTVTTPSGSLQIVSNGPHRCV